MIKKRKFWTEEEDKILLSKSPDESWESLRIRSIPNRTYSAVENRVDQLGLKSPYLTPIKNTFDKDVWKNITPNSCYFGGFSAADGSIFKTSEKRNYHTFAIEIQKSDQIVLELFKEFCSFDGPITTRTVNGGNYSKIRISTKNFWQQDLEKTFGIVQNKTHILQPPNLDSDFLTYCFLTGFFDGDGHISQKDYRLYLTATIASFDFAYWAQDFLNNIVDDRLGLKKRPRKVQNFKIAGNDKIYPKISVCGLPAAIIIDLFRQLPVPRLKRKWDKPEVLNFIEQKKLKHPEKFLTLEIPAQFR